MLEYEEWKKGFFKYVLEKTKLDLSVLPDINDYKVWWDSGLSFEDAFRIMNAS